MVLFWSLAALLVAATLVLLLLPLVRRARSTAAPDADAASTAVYRDQKQGLDAEYADGVITEEEREAALSELSDRLAEEVVAAPKEPSSARRRSVWIVAAVLLVLLPTAAAVLYAHLGKPDAIVTAGKGGHDLSDSEVNAMVDTLAERLKSRPDDAEGWSLLARSYRALGRYADAAQAYAHASALVPDDPSLLADYADVLAMTQGRRLAGKPAELAARALEIDPNHRKALALAATAAMEVRDLGRSRALWERLRDQFPAGSDDARQVAAIIAEVDDMKKSPSSRGAAAAGASPTAATPSIAGRVDVSSALASKVALTDTVFIFARATEGPRMPLAILRIPAKQLPADYRLDDSMGMAAGMKLSSAPSVVVEARISRSGTATPQAGDLSGRSAPVKPGASGVNVTIDQVVQ
jgi:cytochrome c-type biogenesis protein CcmH